MNRRRNESKNNRMNKLRTFEDLECWQACRDLRMFAAKACKGFPKEEEYRLKDQILRATRSMTANIAEGQWMISLSGEYSILPPCQGVRI